MTPQEIRALCQRLGLTQQQLAQERRRVIRGLGSRSRPL